MKIFAAHVSTIDKDIHSETNDLDFHMLAHISPQVIPTKDTFIRGSGSPNTNVESFRVRIKPNTRDSPAISASSEVYDISPMACSPQWNHGPLQCETADCSDIPSQQAVPTQDVWPEAEVNGAHTASEPCVLQAPQFSDRRMIPRVSSVNLQIPSSFDMSPEISAARLSTIDKDIHSGINDLNFHVLSPMCPQLIPTKDTFIRGSGSSNANI
jgi:hypothetical protein